jgi:hypothetical protein
MHKSIVFISALVLSVAFTSNAFASDMCTVYLTSCQNKCLDRAGPNITTCWDQCSVSYMACSGRGPAAGATNKQPPGSSGGKTIVGRPPTFSGNQQPPGGTTTIYRKRY